MMKVLALNFGGADCASSFYRILQYQKPLQELGIELEAFPGSGFTDWGKVSSFDAVIVQKKLFSIGRIRQLRAVAKKLVYDVDDAIWHPHDRPHHLLTRWRTHLRIRKIAVSADCCIAANEVLATHLRRWCPRVEVIPMGLDDLAGPRKSASPTVTLRMGWAGAPVNLVYLEAIEAALLKAQRACPALELVVFSGQRPRFVQGLKYTYRPYEPGMEPIVVRDFDIGLLPLPDNAFAHGKSPIKGLQYMAAGLASVVSPRAATREMFQSGQTALFAESEMEWTNALEQLAQDAPLRRQIGQQARARFEAHHALHKTAQRFADLLRSLGAPKHLTKAPRHNNHAGAKLK